MDEIIISYGVRYEVKSSTEYLELRKNKDLIKYGERLRESIDNADNNEKDMLENILNIYESDKVRGKISGILKISSYLFGIASLIPGIGTVFGAASIAKDAINDISSIKEKCKHAMYNFTAELHKGMNIEKIRRRLKEL